MAYTSVPTVATDDIWTAGQHNTYCRSNSQQSIPYVMQSAGDMAYAASAKSIARLEFTPGSILLSGNNYPEWKPYSTYQYKAVCVDSGGGNITDYYRYIGDMAYKSSGTGQSINTSSETAASFEYSYLGSYFGTWSASDPTKVYIPASFPAGHFYRIIGYLHNQSALS